MVSPKKRLWHCLGACRAGGSAIDWVMRRERVSFRHAVEILLRQDPHLRAEPAERSAPVLRADAAEQELLADVVAYYHETLKTSPEAIAYLDRRGLNSIEAIDHFQLGFANRTLGYHLPKKALKAGAEIRQRLQRLGVLRASGHEHLNGSLVVPIHSAADEVLGLYGRKITEGLRDGTPLHLYLPGPHRGVWNEPVLAESKGIILCELYWWTDTESLVPPEGSSAAIEQYAREEEVKAVLGLIVASAERFCIESGEGYPLH